MIDGVRILWRAHDWFRIELNGKTYCVSTINDFYFDGPVGAEKWKAEMALLEEMTPSQVIAKYHITDDDLDGDLGWEDLDSQP